MIEEIKRMCNGLSLQDKVLLRDYLSHIINNSREGGGMTPLRCSILMGKMASVLGVQRISYVSRVAVHVWARAMIAYQMFGEGYTNAEIGRQMMKDHSTITHLRLRMQDVFDLPEAYRDILDIWNKFQERIENDIHEGTTQDPISLGI